jgi:hypothetical protein
VELEHYVVQGREPIEQSHCHLLPCGGAIGQQPECIAPGPEPEQLVHGEADDELLDPPVAQEDVQETVECPLLLVVDSLNDG